MNFPFFEIIFKGVLTVYITHELPNSFTVISGTTAFICKTVLNVCCCSRSPSALTNGTEKKKKKKKRKRKQGARSLETLAKPQRSSEPSSQVCLCVRVHVCVLVGVSWGVCMEEWVFLHCYFV